MSEALEYVRLLSASPASACSRESDPRVRVNVCLPRLWFRAKGTESFHKIYLHRASASYQNAECTGSGGAASVASDRCCGWHLCARDHSSPFEPNRWICVPTQQTVCTDNFVFSTQNGRLVAHAHLLHPICSVHPRASCSLHCSASTTTQTMSS